jgi:hypothetical protein
MLHEERDVHGMGAVLEEQVGLDHFQPVQQVFFLKFHLLQNDDILQHADGALKCVRQVQSAPREANDDDKQADEHFFFHK